MLLDQIYIVHSRERANTELTADDLRFDSRSSRETMTFLSVSVCSGEPAACLPGENSAFV